MLGMALRDSLVFCQRHWKAIFLIIFPVALPADLIMALVSAYAPEDSPALFDYSVGIALMLLVAPVYQRALILYVSRVNTGQVVSIRELWSAGILLWRPMFLLMLYSLVATLAGLVALIVPGIVIAVRLSLADIHLSLHGGSPVDALKASWRISAPVFWLMLGGYLALGGVIEVLESLVSGGIEGLGADLWPVSALWGALYFALNGVLTIFACRVYDLIRTNQ